MSLMRPEMLEPTVAQLGEVAGAEPVVVEGGGVVVGIDIPEEEVRAADAALGRIDARADAHLDAAQRAAVVGQPDRLRLVARAARC